MHRTRVILADDHTMFRQGLAFLLPPEMDLVATVANGRELVEATRRLQPDLVVADLTMPDLGGLDALRILRQERLHARFIILTVHEDPCLAAEALRAGAIGYVVKQAAGEELIEALRLAVSGRTFLSPLVSGDVVRRLVEGAVSPGEALTSRQREVLRLLAEGHRVKEIAVQLGLSVRTVETHKYEIMHLLEIDNTVNLVKFAIRQGIVTP
jgi:two-component system, NarL family, response regulator NreC